MRVQAWAWQTAAVTPEVLEPQLVRSALCLYTHSLTVYVGTPALPVIRSRFKSSHANRVSQQGHFSQVH